MTDHDTTVVGPIDFIIVEFPAGESNFNGEMIDELGKLMDANTIRLIDAIILVKNDAGAVEALELSEVDADGPLAALEADLRDFLGEDDLGNLAAAMDPGTIAGVLVYENVWAGPFAAAARRAGGKLVADGRIHTQDIAAAIDAERELENLGA
ncbi:DUF6325 family protein [Arthrobacter sp. GMC3]|uniref:DUF6325 family protein n=1 Tax=Arthrobacter sp. GMC3 TaxID=2058894 RepID=UPI000CE40F6D|nr:DUF6325 family protein [Arthrobacter sp. GMC3]